MWFDTAELIPPDESRELREMILKLQPDCIINDRIGNGQGDFQTAEQRLLPSINRRPWEACMTRAQHWSYNKFDAWKSSDTIIQSMIDAISKGGNFLVNVGPNGEGEFPHEGTERLAALGAWMKVNGEAIRGTEPWKIYGEGATSPKADPKKTAKDIPKAADVTDARASSYTFQNFRFTTKNGILYAIGFGWSADRKWTLKSLAENSPQYPGKIATVELLGSHDPITFSRDVDGLNVVLPSTKPCDSAYVLKITAAVQ